MTKDEFLHFIDTYPLNEIDIHHIKNTFKQFVKDYTNVVASAAFDAGCELSDHICCGYGDGPPNREQYVNNLLKDL